MSDPCQYGLRVWTFEARQSIKQHAHCRSTGLLSLQTFRLQAFQTTCAYKDQNPVYGYADGRLHNSEGKRPRRAATS